MASATWRVLVVDGSAEFRAPIVAALKTAGATVAEASSAQVALLALETSPFDQMVTSLSLPDADGYALLRAVRRLPGPAAAIKALAVCGEGTPQDAKVQAIMVGFHLVLTPPCDPEHVALALRGVARLDRAPLEAAGASA